MQEIEFKGIDEKLYFDKCDNGLPIYMVVNEKVNNFYITLSVKYGSVDTEFKTKKDKNFIKVHDGVAHFLEHVNFNEEDGLTAHDYFNKLGSSINAFTTFDLTSYEVFASSNFEDNLNHLLDYVQKPYFTKKLVEKEKGIIIEEVKMGKNNPGHKLFYGMNKALYQKDKRRNYVTGDVEDVKEISVEELKKVYDTFYHPENMFLIITGNFNPYEAAAIVKENQAKKKFKEYLEPIKKEVREPNEVLEKYKTIEANVEIPKVKICYKMNKDIFKGIDLLELNTYLSILLRSNFGTTSYLKDELLEKELIVGMGATRDVFKDVVTIDISIETKYPNEVIPIIEDKIRNMEITEGDLKRRIRCNIASIINDYDDIEYINSSIMSDIMTYEDVRTNLYDFYNSLSLKKANEINKDLDLSNESVVVLVPFEDKK